MSAPSSNPSPTTDPFFLRGKSVLSIKQFNRQQLDHVFKVAHSMHSMVSLSGSCDLLKGRILSTLFYEPSTRTSSSFQAAMLRLGGQVVAINDVSNSSVSKGETLEDTVRCLESYADVIVLRHPEQGAAARAASVLSIPLLNAGDGVGEHPTQALLDTFTIINERSVIEHKNIHDLDGLTITMVGDLKHGRTVHSLARLCIHYKVKLNYVSPAELAMPQYIVDEVAQSGIQQHQYTSLETCLAETDVLYVTRVQKERFASLADYDRVASCYIITPELLTQYHSKPTLRILHPLPRVNEIHVDVDKDPRAAYFRQMKCGLYVRMALLAMVFGRA